MKGNPIIQIKNCYDSLHNKEKMIADVILKNPEKIPYISVVDLAKQAKTSCSSIVRFCKIMGYSGYSEFKTELAMYSYDLTGNLHYALNEEDSSASAATQHLLQLHSRELSAAAEQIDCGRLEEAADAMSSASCVCISAISIPASLPPLSRLVSKASAFPVFSPGTSAAASRTC